MEKIDIQNIYKRDDCLSQFKQYLNEYHEHRNNLSHEKGIYVYGKSGVGKTHFVLQALKELDYDVIYYDAGDIRNKNVIDNLTTRNMSTHNVLSLFQKKQKRIAIVMDEIDGMNTGDKGGINSLIKLIRPKKTKKQRNEETVSNPVICIGNYHTDKKIKELMGVCKILELSTPTTAEIVNIINDMMPSVTDDKQMFIANFIQRDLRKLGLISTFYYQNKSLFMSNEPFFLNIFHVKNHNEDTRNITNKIIQNDCCLQEHGSIMNEADRTIVGLLWHENVIDTIAKIPKKEAIPLYLDILNNICFADYIDRITFQKQIWQFNEMSSLIKTFHTNRILHQGILTKNNMKSVTDIRFTKILTKYSTEYNNSVFIQNLCQILDMDKKDVYSFFTKIIDDDNEIMLKNLNENYEINKLDINRMQKYLAKYITKTSDIPNNCTREASS